MDKKAEDILRDDVDDPTGGRKGTANGRQYRIAEAIVSLIKSVKQKKLAVDEKEQLWSAIDQSQHRARAAKDARHRTIRWGIAAVLLIGVTSVGSLVVAIWQSNEQEVVRKATLFLEDVPQMDSLGLSLDNDSIVQLANETRLRFGENTVRTVGHDGSTRELTLADADGYTTMAVPYGKRTEIALADGTKIWLNAGSYLTFPNTFAADRREVFLRGEAFFEVTHSPGKPFYVYSDELEVKVLGTSFNVSAYKDDDETAAFLVEGMIELSPRGKAKFEKQRLEKGVAATFNKKNGLLDISTKGIDEHIAWTQKQLVLHSTPLPTILKKLERVYNMNVEVDTATIDAEDRFSGILDLQQPLADVLKNIFETNKYAIKQKGRRLTISKP